MNRRDQTIARAGWVRLERRWPELRTWKPLIATVILAVSALANVYQRYDLADTAAEVGVATGIVEDAPVSQEEMASLAKSLAELVTTLTAVGWGLNGVRRKVTAKYKARADVYVTPPRG